MHEKRSRACPVLAWHAGRAQKWQLLVVQQGWSPSKHRLFCTSKKPWGNGAKGRAELASAPNLPWAREAGRARARGAPGRCKSSRQEAGERPRGALTRGCAQCSSGQEARPGGHPGGLSWESRKLPPPGAGHEGHFGGAGAAGMRPKGALARARAQRCRGRQKPAVTLSSPHREGKKASLPPAAAGPERPSRWRMRSRQ